MFSSKKVGGLRFVRLGRLSFSFCVTGKAVSIRRSKPSPRLRSVRSGAGRVFIVA